jgi:hypothetical protein
MKNQDLGSIPIYQDPFIGSFTLTLSLIGLKAKFNIQDPYHGIDGRRFLSRHFGHFILKIPLWSKQAMPQRKGPNILSLGEAWRSLWLGGKSIVQISDETRKDPQIISRALWLAKWPDRLKELVFAYPDIFNRDVLLNGFAGKRRQCEKDGFKLLGLEMKRMIEKGAGSKPQLKNTRDLKPKKMQKKTFPDKDKTSPVFFTDKSTEAEFRIKQALSLHNRVAFSEKGAGEVRIFFENEKDLAFILERIEELKSTRSQNNQNDLFLGFVDS